MLLPVLSSCSRAPELAQVFKFLRVNDRMSMLWKTLSRASTDLLTFAVFFVIIFFGFAFMGQLLFGTEVRQYATFDGAVTTLFRLILGDFSYDDIYAVNRVLAPIVRSLAAVRSTLVAHLPHLRSSSSSSCSSCSSPWVYLLSLRVYLQLAQSVASEHVLGHYQRRLQPGARSHQKPRRQAAHVHHQKRESLRSLSTHTLSARVACHTSHPHATWTELLQAVKRKWDALRNLGKHEQDSHEVIPVVAAHILCRTG